MRILLALTALLPWMVSGQIALDVQLQLINANGPVAITYTLASGGAVTTQTEWTDSLGFDQTYLPINGMFNAATLGISFVNCLGETVDFTSIVNVNPAGGNTTITLTAEFCAEGGGGGEGGEGGGGEGGEGGGGEGGGGEGGGGEGGGGSEDCTAAFTTTQALDAAGNPIPNQVWVVLDTLYINGQYLWNFGDEGTSTESLPTHTYDGSGPYTLCAQVTVPTANNAMCTAYFCDSLSIDESGMLQFLSGFTITVMTPDGTVVGVSNPSVSSEEIQVFPNPISAGETLQWTVGGGEAFQWSVFNAQGAMMATSEKNPLTPALVSTAGWTPGTYVVRFTQGETVTTRRIILE
jgi:hypothetical protein